MAVCWDRRSRSRCRSELRFRRGKHELNNVGTALGGTRRPEGAAAATLGVIAVLRAGLADGRVFEGRVAAGLGLG